MRYLLIIFAFICCTVISRGQNNDNSINPTGTYNLITNSKDKNYSGTINVKLLGGNKIAIGLDICMGGTALNNGTIRDTLKYLNNWATYTTQDDTSCKITFIFSDKSIKVTQKAADYNFSCGFGHGVVADGNYKKNSSKIPSNENLKWQ